MFPNDRSGREQIDHLEAEVARRPAITVFTNAELVGKSGSFGNYEAEVRVNSDPPETITRDGRLHRHRHRVRQLRARGRASSATASPES